MCGDVVEVSFHRPTGQSFLFGWEHLSRSREYEFGLHVVEQVRHFDIVILLTETRHRYVDLTEAIDSNDTSFLDNSEYNVVDGIPLNGPLPTVHYLSTEVRFYFFYTFEFS